MGRKQIIPYHNLVERQDTASNIVAPYTSVEMVDLVKFTIVWAAASSPGGSISIETSDDKEVWHELNIGAIPLGTPSGVHNVHVMLVDYKYIRAKYASNSVQGEVSIFIKGNSISS